MNDLNRERHLLTLACRLTDEARALVDRLDHEILALGSGPDPDDYACEEHEWEDPDPLCYDCDADGYEAARVRFERTEDEIYAKWEAPFLDLTERRDRAEEALRDALADEASHARRVAETRVIMMNESKLRRLLIEDVR